MVQYPEFDKPAKFGTSMEGAVPSSGRVARTLEDPIAEGDRVSLQYKGTQLFVIVTRVVAPQETYEGRVQGFVTPERVFEVEDLKAGCIVGFRATTTLGALNEGRQAARARLMPASPTPRWKARLADLGGIALTGSPSDFR